MSQMIPCPDCGQQVSKKAEACPQCGREIRGSFGKRMLKRYLWFLAGLSVLMVGTCGACVVLG